MMIEDGASFISAGNVAQAPAHVHQHTVNTGTATGTGIRSAATDTANNTTTTTNRGGGAPNSSNLDILAATTSSTSAQPPPPLSAAAGDQLHHHNNKTTHHPNISNSASTTSRQNSNLQPADNRRYSLGFHFHRQSNTSSKLPAFRSTGRRSSSISSSQPPSAQPSPSDTPERVQPHDKNAAAPETHVFGSNEHNRGFNLAFDHRDNHPALSTPTFASKTQTTPHQPDKSTRTVNTDYEAAFDSGSVHPQERLQRSSTYPLVTPVKPHVEEYIPPGEPDLSSPSVTRRDSASRSSLGYTTSSDRPLSLKRQRTYASDGYPSAVTSPEAHSPSEVARGQRELLLPKSLSQTSTPDERRVSSQRPPLSYKPPPQAAQTAQPVNSTPVRVPPIRGFRSSGSRKSLTLDMDHSPRFQNTGDEPTSPGFDRTLRALEGRQIAGMLQMTPPTSARHEGSDADDSGDVFLKIAREEASRRNTIENVPDEAPVSVPHTYRSHRRPQSTNVASYQPTSPPFMSRRLSDHQERSRSRHEDDRASEIIRSTTQRSTTWDRAMSAHPAEDLYRTKTTGALRPSALAARPATRQETGHDTYSHARRRSSITDQNSTPPVRTSTYRSSGTGGHAYGKSYNSSPLVRSFDITGNRQHDPVPHAVEGTESTASNTAPSTVWDELDDLKSRIHRLELTGKLPSTSAAAVSRLSDERPPTATTTVTTMSSSPKRNGGTTQVNEGASTTSSQRDAYPILVSALSKSRPFLNSEVFRALEAAANDAMGLSSMMGVAGQPGPVSSAASTIGTGAALTDRQLRRKAESVCRSLTELCVALGEDVAHARPVQASHSQKPSLGQQQQQSPITLPASQTDGPSTPTVNKVFSNLVQKRPSVVTEQALPKPTTSPSRAMSKFEERRNTILNGTSLPSPRAPTSGPTTPQDSTASRRSSLMFPRTRRAVTEEPEEVGGRRSSLLLRSRRGGTEEPEEGRQTSLMYRGRRGTIGEGEEESRSSVTPRAYTEVNAPRGSTREYTEVASSTRAPTREYAPHTHPMVEETTPQPASALPRRRYVSSSPSVSRLAMPSTAPTAPTTPSALPTRRYLERSVPERDPANAVDRYAEERAQRYHSTLPLNRSGSLNGRRQNRDSTITNISTAATTGGYR